MCHIKGISLDVSIGHHSFAHQWAMSIQDSRIHSDPRLCVISRRLDPICSHGRTVSKVFQILVFLFSGDYTYSRDMSVSWSQLHLKVREWWTIFFYLRIMFNMRTSTLVSPVDSGFLYHMRNRVRSLKSWWV